MEFALKALWEGRRGGRLLHSVYQAMGGIKGAVAQRAEAVYGKLDPAQQRIAQRLFTRLVRPGDESGDTRRRACLDELDAAEVALVREFAGKGARLLVTDRTPPNERETVDVAHEALIREWDRLGTWVDEVRETRKDQLLMDDLAAQWREQGKPCLSGLASGRTLKRFEQAGAASELAGEYLRASRARRRLGQASAALGVLVLVAALGGLAWLDAHDLTVRHPLAAALNAVGLWKPIEPDMILISEEAGHPMRFVMGLDSPEESWLGPPHEVQIARPYRIGRDEVTFAEYDRFALATWRQLPDDQDWGRSDRPVINVSWEDARGYVDWLREETGKGYRLPSEAEWEHAARAGTITPYWWGDDIQQDGQVWANCAGCGSQWDLKRTAPVGQFQANPFGLLDTAGNVWEWVEDCWHDNYAAAPTDGLAWLAADGGDCGQRVVRGGSWNDGPEYLRSAYRIRLNADNRNNALGFRLAQDL